VFLRLLDWLQVGVLALGTLLGRGHAKDLINVLGFGSLPRRMAHGSAAFFGLRGGAIRRWSGERFAAFELAAVQGAELGLELLIVALQLRILGVGFS
jgi:hypothetical protein